MKLGATLLFLICSVSLAEMGLVPFQEGSVDFKNQGKVADANHKSLGHDRLDGENAKLIREIVVHPYQTTESQKVLVGEFLGEEVWFDPRLRPTRCLQSAMETHNFAKTPEPSSFSLLFLGGTALLAWRRKT